MKVPNTEQAVVPRAKLADYLLAPGHRDGQHKARFFSQFGLSQDNWQELENLVRQHVEKHEIVKEEPSPFGTRYVVDGIMKMPDGRMPQIRSVWFVRFSEGIPRFVTAYPVKSKN
jgi:hypothetical protein